MDNALNTGLAVALQLHEVNVYDLLHECCLLAGLLTHTIHDNFVSYTKVGDELYKHIPSHSLGFHWVSCRKEVFHGKDMSILVPIKQFEVSILNLGLSYIQSALYHHASSRIADLRTHWVVTLMVCIACCKPINHLSLRSSADTIDFLFAKWNVLAAGRLSLQWFGS